MPLTDIYPTLTEEQRANVLKTIRGEIIEHDGRHWMAFLMSSYDGATTKLVTVGKDNTSVWKDVVLYKDKDKVVFASDVITTEKINYWLSDRFDLVGLYF
jgi:hypothetical protein